MNNIFLQKTLFICFVIVFIASFALMAWGLTLQFNNPDIEIPLLGYLTELITGEVVIALIALFYYTFNLSKNKQPVVIKETKEQYFSYREFMNTFIKKGSNVEIYCSGVDQFSEFFRTLDLSVTPKNVIITIHYRDRNDNTILNNINSIKSSLSKYPKLNWKINFVALGWKLTFPSLLVVDGEHAALDYYINRDPEKPKNTILILGKYVYSNIKNDTSAIARLAAGYRGAEYLDKFIIKKHGI